MIDDQHSTSLSCQLAKEEKCRMSQAIPWTIIKQLIQGPNAVDLTL